MVALLIFDFLHFFADFLRLIFQFEQALAAYSWQINMAFIERFNLTLRQHVPGLTLPRSAARLSQRPVS